MMGNPMNDNPQPVPPIQGPTEAQIRQWNMWCHLSTLAGLLVPFGNVIGPLLIWQIKKADFPAVEVHGKAALNFQLTVLIAVVAGLILAFVLSFFCVGWLLFPLVMLIGLAGFIFPIIAGIKANEGKEYKYPWSLTLF
jgi:uncharacterized Tic20 family protein